MTVFKSADPDYIQFRMAQLDISKIDEKYRKIVLDLQAQTGEEEIGEQVNGNAEDLAASLGAELADLELYNQLKLNKGWVWLDSSGAKGVGLIGDDDFQVVYANAHNYDGSFCASLRVKKA